MDRMAYLVAAVLGLAVAVPTAAQALNTRSYVSAVSGSDSNACTPTAPCRTFAHAITKTEAGGEIDALEPGGYGPVTITKAISIVGVGNSGIIASSGGNGITINAGASDVINLRGLIVEGAGVGKNGIAFSTGQTLTIENCVVRNHSNNGIQFQPSLTSSDLVVSDTFVANNKGGNGIVIQPIGSGTVRAILTRVEADNNGGGILVDGSLYVGANFTATIADSVAAGNSGVGFMLNSLTATVSLMVFRSVAANNGTGISAQGPSTATLRIGQSSITGNASGWTISGGGAVKSYGDNKIDGNGSNQSAPPAISSK